VVGFTLLFAFAAALRVAFLGNQQLFRDEATSWYLANHSLGDMLRLGAHETFPPLYLVLLKGWMALFGDSETAIRSLSVVAGLATLGVTWRWARDAVGAVEAWIAGAVVAVSPLLVANSRDARMYSLEGLFVTGAWWVLWLLVVDGDDWTRRRRTVVAIALGLLVGGEVWTLSLGIPNAGLQLAFALVALAWLRRWASVLAAGCVVIGVVSLAPWLPNLIATATNGQPFWTPRPDVGALATTFRTWFVGQPGDAWALVLLYVGVALFGLVWMLHGVPEERPTDSDGLRPARSSPRARLLALALVLDFGLVPAVWAYSQLHSIYDPRYLGAAVPPFAIAVGASAVSLGRLLRNRFRAARFTPNGLLASLFVLPLICATAFASGQSVLASSHDAGSDPGRQVAQELATLVQPGDVVVAVNAQSYFPLAYYLETTGEAQRLGIQLYDWHAPTASLFTGWADIDSSARIEPTTVDRVGWRSAVHLGPGRSIWVVSLVDSDHERICFSPLETGQLREVDRIIVHGYDVVAQIRKAVPSGP
jgi:4-amino-4-deoxy-L-arabinose transferase-like glycosyltransferase